MNYLGPVQSLGTETWCFHTRVYFKNLRDLSGDLLLETELPSSQTVTMSQTGVLRDRLLQ